MIFPIYWLERGGAWIVGGSVVASVCVEILTHLSSLRFALFGESVWQLESCLEFLSWHIWVLVSSVDTDS
jgi:hypothetical protein